MPDRPVVAFAGEHGSFAEDAIEAHFPDAVAIAVPTFREVFEVVERGCRTAGLRQASEDAYADWCAWARAGGYSPDDAEWTKAQRAAHDQWYRRASHASHAIRSTTAAIIAAGCRDDVDQHTLF